MTARRALPEPPTSLQRFAALITQGQRHDRLVSALEDHVDRLESLAREYDQLDQYWLATSQRDTAQYLRHILQEHS